MTFFAFTIVYQICTVYIEWKVCSVLKNKRSKGVLIWMLVWLFLCFAGFCGWAFSGNSFSQWFAVLSIIMFFGAFTPDFGGVTFQLNFQKDHFVALEEREALTETPDHPTTCCSCCGSNLCIPISVAVIFGLILLVIFLIQAAIDSAPAQAV